MPGFTSKTYDAAEKQIRYDNYTTGFVYQSFQTSGPPIDEMPEASRDKIINIRHKH